MHAQTGTAAVVNPVRAIHYMGEDLLAREGNTDIGPFARRVFETLGDIQYGRTPHEWSVVIGARESAAAKAAAELDPQ